MRIQVTIAAVLSIFWTQMATAADPATPKLIGHWKLAGDTRDSSGNELHAENHGVVFEADKAGPLPTHAKFGGRGQHLTVPHSDLLNLGTDDFTTSLWVHTDKLLDDDI